MAIDLLQMDPDALEALPRGEAADLARLMLWTVAHDRAMRVRARARVAAKRGETTLANVPADDADVELQHQKIRAHVTALVGAMYLELEGAPLFGADAANASSSDLVAALRPLASALLEQARKEER